MKYILWPILAIIMEFGTLTYFLIRGILRSIWHFRILTVREIFTEDDEYIFEDWDWKIYLKMIFDYDYHQRISRFK